LLDAIDRCGSLKIEFSADCELHDGGDEQFADTLIPSDLHQLSLTIRILPDT